MNRGLVLMDNRLAILAAGATEGLGGTRHAAPPCATFTARSPVPRRRIRQ
jgi:hypothetical protein